MNPTKMNLTLGDCLCHTNETIRRNALSILKTLSRSQNVVKPSEQMKFSYCAANGCHNRATTRVETLDGNKYNACIKCATSLVNRW